MVSVEAPLTAAASSSLSSDFAVPGSPTSKRPREVASVTRQRSTSDGAQTTLRSSPSSWSPKMNARAALGESAQPGGLGCSSLARSRSSSWAWSTSAGGRW
jgi:hypothetical protein